MSPVGGQSTEIGQRIAAAESQGALDLSGQDLTQLPAEVGKLHRLRALDLSRTSLVSLPGWISKLERLQFLSLSGTPLETLPREIGLLEELEQLALDNTRLTTLPSTIGGLAGLQGLWLRGTQLRQLPPEIGRLTSLQHLSLAGTKLTGLPPQLWQLPKLEHLDLSGTAIATIPAEVEMLRRLQELDLQQTPVTQLPPQIGRLKRLRRLDLSWSELTALPNELAGLPDTVDLRLEGAPLREPLPSVVEQGVPALFAYLHSLAAGARPQYEAKLVLVGEGNVGKTSLVAALRGEPFEENRATTHGIELRQLGVPHPHPGLDTEITLNTWDFGGQEIYRVTSQFFFSRRSLYLVAWRPREGHEDNSVEDWIKRIRLRVGEGARIIVVATYGDERMPELDYPELRRRYGSLLANRQYVVDNRSGSGVEELRAVIAREAAQLPQMGELLNPGWAAARTALLQRSQSPYVLREEFERICSDHGLEVQETSTVARLFHDLGHIIHYEDDDGLRDIIVLRPEWLTRAIGYVLEDIPTRDAGGVLRHDRLEQIWRRTDRASYEPSLYPYFLRLMEKFDVSYRLQGENASLVAQIVPYERPKLPWDDQAEPSASAHAVKLACAMSDSPPGLIPWLIVRTHRYATGLHWRRGVFLRHHRYPHEALFELVGNQRVELTVRAPSDYFLSVLQETLEELLASRWPGLRYDLNVPCPTVREDGTRCDGELPLDGIRQKRDQEAQATIDCHRCLVRLGTNELLAGYPQPATMPQALAELDERFDRLEVGMDRNIEMLAAIESRQRLILRLLSHEITDCPRLFTIAPAQASRWRPARVFQEEYRLTLWCEEPGEQHPHEPATYEITEARRWLLGIAPYARVVCQVLRAAGPVAAAAAGVLLPQENPKSATQATSRIKSQLELVKAIAQQLPANFEVEGRRLESVDDWDQGVGLRILRSLLLELDGPRQFGGLQQIFTSDSDILWLCPSHYSTYDPGLPQLPVAGSYQ